MKKRITTIYLLLRVLLIESVSIILIVLENRSSLFPFNMEQFILYYTIFCLTTAIFCWIFVFNSIKNRLIFEEKSDHIFIKKPIISSIAFMGLVAAMSPIFIPVVLFDSVRETFIKGMYEGSL